MPIGVTLGILVWIGLIITAQAFQEVPKAHAIAVAIGFVPALAAWGELLIETALRKAGPGYALKDVAATFAPDLFIYGMLALVPGFLLISIFFSAIVAKVIDRQWLAAAGWCLVASASSACGIIHAFVWFGSGLAPAPFQWTGFDGAIPSGIDFAVIYLVAAGLLGGMHFFQPREVAP
jgi:AGZA family xanthine/uracil permease-like MFS transporter